MLAPTPLCWCCGADLVARVLPGLTVLECVACQAGSTIAAPQPVTDTDVRCGMCHKYIIQQATRPWRLCCPRCKATTTSERNTA